MQVNGCNNITQFVAYKTLIHVGLSVKVIAVIILFL